MFCTKCGNKLKEKDKFCPNCGKEIIKEEVKEVEKREENTQNTIKQTNNPAPATENKPPVNETNPVPFIIIGVVVIAGIIIFIFVFIFIILIGVFTAIDENDYEYDYHYSENTTIPNYKETYENLAIDIEGGWENTDGSYFVFNKNKSFYWYKSKDTLNDNYYYGYLEILKGDKALKDLGITEERAKKVIDTSNGTINKNNIYALKLYPTYLLADGENKTKEKIKTGSNMQLLFVKWSNSKAEAYNFDTGATFHLEKEEDTI